MAHLVEIAVALEALEARAAQAEIAAVEAEALRAEMALEAGIHVALVVKAKAKVTDVVAATMIVPADHDSKFPETSPSPLSHPIRRSMP